MSKVAAELTQVPFKLGEVSGLRTQGRSERVIPSWCIVTIMEGGENAEQLKEAFEC
jgi:hypothetical protein